MNPKVRHNFGPNKLYERILRFMFALIGAHIIVVNGTSESLFVLLLTPAYYFELGFSLAVALIMITWISYISYRLDKQHPWPGRLAERSAMQFGLGIAIPALFEFFCVYLYFQLGAGLNVLESSFMDNEFRIVVLMICFFNLYCMTRYFYYELVEVKSQDKRNFTLLQDAKVSVNTASSDEVPDLDTPHAEQLQESFIVHTLTRTYPIAVKEIAYFYRDQGHVFIRPFSGDDQLISQSLDQIENMLNPKQFFRVARHMIVSYDAIVDYRPLNFGKLELTLSLPYKEPARVSKLSAHNFRVWMQR